MDNRVRIRSAENIVKNASVELRADDGEWHDVRRAVTAAKVDLSVGEPSRVALELVLADVDLEAAELHVDELALTHTAAVLRACGYTVEAPAAAEPVEPLEPA